MSICPNYVTFPYLPDGSQIQLDLLECSLCGAAVSDEARHERWHREVVRDLS